MNPTKALIFIFLLFCWKVGAQVQCNTDVSIVEGDTIYMCQNALQTITANSGLNGYLWTGPETQSGQSITPNFQGTYVVEATDEFACTSYDTIEVVYYPAIADAIVSSEGSTICPGSAGTTLSLSGSYMLYDWNGQASTPTFQVTDPGNYYVSVADANGCIATFNYTITQPTFTLESSTGTACIGSSVVLTAGGGSNYQWSTGETGSVIVVSPAITTTYSVTITLGSCVQTLSIPVTMGEAPEYELPDTVYLQDGQIEYFQGPDGFETYNWYPGTDISDTSAAGIFFTAGESQTLYLEATHAAGCTILDSIVIIVVDVTLPTGVSPNSDGINDMLVFPELENFDGSLIVWNRWGDVVYESDNYQNDWGCTCEAPLCYGNLVLPEGTYFYLLDVHDITFKSYFTLKVDKQP